jgi:hypothetical protein
VESAVPWTSTLPAESMTTSEDRANAVRAAGYFLNQDRFSQCLNHKIDFFQISLDGDPDNQ